MLFSDSCRLFILSTLHLHIGTRVGSSTFAVMGTLRHFLCMCFILYAVKSDVPELESFINKLDGERAPASVQESAVRGVLQRLLPSHVSSFQFKIVSKAECGGHACFRINNHPFSGKKEDAEIIIKGTTGVEISAGLHWYLKYWCGAHVSWDKTGGVQLDSVPQPGSLPYVQTDGVRVQRAVQWNYYQNAVTSSYTFVWWDWKRWEKEIDWMALQGVNLPLTFTGQEAIWQKVFQRYNMSKTDLDDFFGGPAFLAWERMGNLHGWGGPLPQSWLDQQLMLQKCILSRMRELGMTPVLPAFSGNVPGALQYIFPSAKITKLDNWFTVDANPRWCCTFLLDATDARFVEIGQAFIQQQIQEYGGTSHIYNCDTFDENTPPTNDPEYISTLGAAVFKAMHAGDKDAIWLMQGWLFSYDPFWKAPQMKALLHSVPVGRMIVLDLFADVKPVWNKSDQFYGTPYIWCMLHNFAGNIEMYGVLDAIASGPVEARTSQNSTMVGVGMCMEGIEQNPVVYDLMSEMAFRGERVHVEDWIKKYSKRRYGRVVPAVQEAWNILYGTVYNCTDGAYDKNRDFIVAFPDIDPSIIPAHEVTKDVIMPKSSKSTQPRRISLMETSSPFVQPHLWYSPSEVIGALQLFLDGGDALSESLTFRYDLVDLTRQALAKLANQIFLNTIRAFHENDAQEASVQSQIFLDLIRDMDVLLASDDGFLLGPWLESAKQLAQNPSQQQQYEWNARTQITMWFDNTELEPSLLHDYANKYWSGLLRDYYLPRASIYFDHLLECMEANKDFPFVTWRKNWITLTNSWQDSSDLYSVKAEGNALNISRALFKKYFEGLKI
eukprot:Gb_23620 [translate_table: standard]